MSECTHDCSSCGESCASREPQSLLKAHHADAHVGKVYGIVSGKGGVIMDVTTPEQARIAEAAGACALSLIHIDAADE